MAAPVHLILLLHLRLKLIQFLILNVNTHHACRPFDASRRQINLDVDVWYGNPLGPSKYEGLRDLLPVGLVAAVVLELDVEVEAALRAEIFITIKIGAYEVPRDVFGRAAVVFLAAVAVPLAAELLEVLGVEALDLEDFGQIVVYFARGFLVLGHERVVL